MITFTESLKSGQRAWTKVTRVAKTAVLLQVRNNGVIVQDATTLYVAATIT